MILAKVLLTDDWVADSKGLILVQAASLMSSVFLMRLQS